MFYCGKIMRMTYPQFLVILVKLYNNPVAFRPAKAEI